MSTCKVFLTLVGLLLLTGCTLLSAKEDIEKLQSISLISGVVHSPGVDSVVVACCRPTEEGYEVVQLNIIEGRGGYYFDVDEGSYSIIAFVDKNRNLIYDAGEIFNSHENLLPVQARINLPVRMVDIDLTQSVKVPEDVPTDFTGVEHVHLIDFGEIGSLDDERFSPATSRMGLWEPYRYAHEVGFGLFLEHEWDPQKVPVIFVHGASGSPENFRGLVRHLDKERFQLGYFYYPSGLRLDSVSRFLTTALRNLQQKHGPKNFILIAHSMGGLVARKSILDYTSIAGSSDIPLFLSISTPWGGHSAAKLGVDKSPVVVPSWRDMDPSSAFLKDIWAKRLPASVDYHLMFSFKGKSNDELGNNDGVVSIGSQLDPRAQIEATRIYGHNSGHTEILFEGDTIRQIVGLLESIHKENDH